MKKIEKLFEIPRHLGQDYYQRQLLETRDKLNELINIKNTQIEEGESMKWILIFYVFTNNVQTYIDALPKETGVFLSPNLNPITETRLGSGTAIFQNKEACIKAGMEWEKIDKSFKYLCVADR